MTRIVTADSRRAWFAVHVVMLVKFKRAVQRTFPLWENIILVRARTADEAEQIALRDAKLSEGDASGTFTWNGKAATWVCIGARRTVEIRNSASNNARLTEVNEVTYLSFELESRKELKSLMSGKRARVQLVE
jgi:hypothetical protein